MNRLNQVNMTQTTRRFGLPQVALLTGAFATAVLLALAFRPARIPSVELGAQVAAPAPATLAAPRDEREDAQLKLVAAMARFASAQQKEQEQAAPVATAPAPAAVPVPAPASDLAFAPGPAPVPLAPAAPPAPAPITAPVTAAPPGPASPPLSPSDLRRLTDKAAQAIRDGDIFGARLILEREVSAGDANAILALAETYDPNSLARMNVKGVRGDISRARELYGEALAKGVTEARGRLEALDH